MISREKLAISLAIAILHFVICCILGAIVSLVSIGYTMSDYYEPAAWWFVVLDHTLLLLEMPVVIVLCWIYHPVPLFEPPHFFLVDLLYPRNFPVALGLCVLWSFLFGCLIVSAKSLLNRPPKINERC